MPPDRGSKGGLKGGLKGLRSPPSCHAKPPLRPSPPSPTTKTQQSCSRPQQMGSWRQTCRLHDALHAARSVFTASSLRSNTSHYKPIKLEVCVDPGCIKNVHKTGCTSIVVVCMSKAVGTRTAPRDIAITIATRHTL